LIYTPPTKKGRRYWVPVARLGKNVSITIVRINLSHNQPQYIVIV
jgi:hypothetical protein